MRCFDETSHFLLSKKYTVKTGEMLENDGKQRVHGQQTMNSTRKRLHAMKQKLNNKRATIKQDYKNNNLRPTSACTMYDNMFICGDWTMKNRPCCIETAIESAIRIGNIFSKLLYIF